MVRMESALVTHLLSVSQVRLLVSCSKICSLYIGGSASGKVYLVRNPQHSYIYEIIDSCRETNRKGLGLNSNRAHLITGTINFIESINYMPSQLLSQDSFYKFHTPEEIALAFESKFDLDHPDAIDIPMFAAVPSHCSCDCLLSITKLLFDFSVSRT